jgi:hypothetical protein
MKYNLYSPIDWLEKKQTTFAFFLVLMYLLFILFLVVEFWFNVGVLLTRGDLPAYHFFKNIYSYLINL